MNIGQSILILFLVLMLGGLGSAEQTRSGFGTAKLPDSSVYEGEFRNGLFNGKGTLTQRNGTCYEGEFRDGLFEGRGKLAISNGTIYEENFVRV